ncbi:MAG TPA: M28 family peptidase [Oligoflexus sp.]|uniref:M28 family peptidase n=1 Tax=Oligoflexus sp. TaxID=1971216 RepID=UPI002D43159D|nr:M28 family peptidase [Oligoflexus sp.]HYX37611.1 M28 family peptidase [Oligoflexus sp.]
MRLRHHIDTLLAFGPRDARHPEVLEKVESCLEQELQSAGGRVSKQNFETNGQWHHNIISRFGPVDGSRVVIGAHFDAYRGLPGADDNGSGVAVLLELARILGERLVGIEFSDHSSYWRESYPAFMITGTAFYRNPRYHTPDDTANRLDYGRLASVVQAVHALIP